MTLSTAVTIPLLLALEKIEEQAALATDPAGVIEPHFLSWLISEAKRRASHQAAGKLFGDRKNTLSGEQQAQLKALYCEQVVFHLDPSFSHHAGSCMHVLNHLI